MRKLILITLFTSFIFLTGCADKVPEANRPAAYWYKNMVKEIARNDLEKAGDHYASLRSEHIHSPLLPEAMIMMADAHMKNEQYLLANYYLDEYIKRFADKDGVEFARFMKLKANYMSFDQPGRNQKLLRETVEKAEAFGLQKEGVLYAPYARTMVANLEVASDLMDEEIAGLYERIDKPESAKIYRKKSAISEMAGATVIQPETPWYRALFE